MSRTYRRTKNYSKGWMTDKGYYCSEWTWDCGYYHQIPLSKDSEEYKRKSAKYHSDAGTTNFKEPGPSWFRNLYSERPQRRFNKNELHKFMLDTNYEPMCVEMDKMPYWT